MKLTKREQQEIIETDGYCIEYKQIVTPNRLVIKRIYYLNGDIYSLEDGVNMLSKTFYDMDKINYLVKDMENTKTKFITIPDSFKIRKGLY